MKCDISEGEERNARKKERRKISISGSPFSWTYCVIAGWFFGVSKVWDFWVYETVFFG